MRTPSMFIHVTVDPIGTVRLAGVKRRWSMMTRYGTTLKANCEVVFVTPAVPSIEKVYAPGATLEAADRVSPTICVPEVRSTELEDREAVIP